MVNGDSANNEDIPMIWLDTDEPPPATGADVTRSVTSSTTVARPWGPWATLAWTLICMSVITVVQIGVLIAFALVQTGFTTKGLTEITNSSLFLSASTLTSTPVVLGLIAMLIYVRGCPIREYLALMLPTARQALLAITGLAALLFVGDSLTYLLGRPLVPLVMVDIYKTGWFSLLLPTLVIAAPVGEEILFRGFMYHGIASSRWGSTTAVFVSAVAWAAIHVQYDLYSIIQIAGMGLYLGEVRRRTASVPLTVLLHGIANAVATVEMMIMVHLQGR